MPLGPQGQRQFAHLLIGLPEGFEIGQLAADMHVDPHHLDPRQTGRHGIDGGGLGDGDAKFVLGFAGGDLFMGLGIDIGVDADSDGRAHAQRCRNLGKRDQFRFAFDVELPDAARQRHVHFFPRLADAGKDDPLTRNAGGLGAQVFAARDHIHARAQTRQMRDHRLVGIRLHREAHKVIHARQRLLEQAKMARQRGAGIDIEGRADRGRDIGDRHVFGMQDAVLVKKVIHRVPAHCFRAR